MKKIILLSIAAIYAWCTPCRSQQYGWTDIGKNLPISSGTVTLSDMYWVGDNEGWICSGFTGEIYHTIDGGKSFTIQTTQYAVYAIHMLNSMEGYAGGLQGRVYRTINGGGIWSVIGTIGGTLLSINFAPGSATGYCCGYSGKIYSITSAGVSAMNSGVISNLASINFPGSQGWVCGEAVIEHFTGSVWQGDQAYPTEIYNGIAMINNDIGWAIGDNGIIVKTIDGKNWNIQKNPDNSKRTLNRVSFINVNVGWAVGDGGTLLHTTNGGSVWSIEAAGMTSNMLTSVKFTSSTNGYALGNNKTLLKYGFVTSMASDESGVSGSYRLFQNYPNPFNPSTTISFSLQARTFVSLKVFDVMGREVATLASEELSAGSFTRRWNAAGMPSGIYFYRLQAGAFTETKRLILLK
jgi:photosystem II stability/assembly factor-like uncharacterized protein